ncbi:MAG: histidine kinase, partial [Deltaproteobacteria bacterium]|nr:histidine kinase [Deltaproteobacteria bacterium]
KARRLGPAIEKTLFRAVQEGLTNVRKHAVDPKRVRIIIEYESAGVALRVWNNGLRGKPCSGNPVSDSPARFGLRGLKERITEHGGTLTAEPIPKGGFQLKLRIRRIEENQ